MFNRSRFELPDGRSEDSIAGNEEMMRLTNRIKGVFSLFVMGFFLNVIVIFANADLSTTGNKMLIITTPEYAKVLSKYVGWKIKRGLDVELDIRSAEKGAETIKRKIQEKYDQDSLTYIVLVGDIDDVPSVMLAGIHPIPATLCWKGMT